MKIILFSRSQLPHTAPALRELFAAINRYGFDYALNREFAEVVGRLLGIDIAPGDIYDEHIGEQPDHAVMVCYGGDGTLLEGIHRLGNRKIPVLGINAGHLGFLTGDHGGSFDEIFGEIAADNLSTEPRSMLQIEGDFPSEPHQHLALNEFAIQRYGSGMISVETYVDDQLVATYHGDGVILSTPTGSTAYSLSAGGPVVAPTCECFVISPLAPHNLTMRPIVIPDSSRVTFRVNTRHTEASISFDDRSYPITNGTTFTLRRAKRRIYLCVPHNISFYDTLRNKMMWGIDPRS